MLISTNTISDPSPVTSPGVRPGRPSRITRLVAAATLVGAGIVVTATTAAAQPMLPTPPGIELEDITVETIPPVTIPPVTFPPFTIPPELLDPGFEPPVDPPVTVPPVIVNPTTTVPPSPPTIPPVIVNPTTTVPPVDPTNDPTDEPTDDPAEVPGDDVPGADVPGADVPAEVQGATETASNGTPSRLATTGNDSVLPLVGASLLVSGSLIFGGLAYDRRRKARV